MIPELDLSLNERTIIAEQVNTLCRNVRNNSRNMNEQKKENVESVSAKRRICITSTHMLAALRDMRPSISAEVSYKYISCSLYLTSSLVVWYSRVFRTGEGIHKYMQRIREK